MPCKLCATSPAPAPIILPTKRRGYLPSWVGVSISETVSRISLLLNCNRQITAWKTHSAGSHSSHCPLSFTILPHYVKSGVIEELRVGSPYFSLAPHHRWCYYWTFTGAMFSLHHLTQFPSDYLQKMNKPSQHCPLKLSRTAGNFFIILKDHCRPPECVSVSEELILNIFNFNSFILSNYMWSDWTAPIQGSK